jgi:phage shock protein E
MVTKIVIGAIAGLIIMKFMMAQSGSISPAEAVKMMKENPGIVLDVRTPGEVSGGMVKGAINSNYTSDQFEKDSEKWDKTKTYYVYCASGMRSGKATASMKAKGFTNVFNVGGFAGLKGAGAEVK